MLYVCDKCGSKNVGKSNKCFTCNRGNVAPTDSFEGDVGFLSPACYPIGGVESWHESLLPNLRSVSGFVVLYPDYATGLSDARFGCKTRRGLEDAKSLATSSKVLVCWNVGDFIQTIASSAPNTKLVAISHATQQNKWTNSHIAYAEKYADKVVTVCPAGIDLDLLHTRPLHIPNAPDPKRLQVHNVLQKPSKRLAIAITRLSREKRLHILAEAFGEHLQDHDLWIIGSSNGLDCPNIPSYENVKILPPTQTPGDYYAIADLAVSASEEEGYGLSSAEALLAGLPLVSTQVGFLQTKPHLGNIVSHEASPEQWAAAIRSAEKKPTEDLDRFESFVASWQGLIDDLIATPSKSQVKMGICRSNACGHYLQERDACELLVNRGGAGRISYLQNNPWLKCVDDPPQF